MADLYDLLAAQLQNKEYYEAQDPFYRGGQALMGAPWGTPKSSADLFGAALIKGLGGGILTGIGRENARQSAYNAYGEIPFLQAQLQGRPKDLYGPMTLEQTQDAISPLYGRKEAPEDWSVESARPEAILGLLQARSINDIQNKNAELLSKLQIEASPAYLGTIYKKAAAEGAGKKGGELDAYRSYYDASSGALPSDNLPLDPTERGKAILQLEDTAYKRVVDSPVYKQFSDINSNFKTLVALKDKEEGPAAPAMITAFTRILDPGSTVREGEYKTVNQNIQSLLDQLQGNWRAAMQGKTPLGKKAREALVEIAAEKYNEFGKAYEGHRSSVLETLARQGGNTQNLPITGFEPFEGKPTPPAGYELTGRRDANGNWGIRPVK